MGLPQGFFVDWSAGDFERVHGADSGRGIGALSDQSLGGRLRVADDVCLREVGVGDGREEANSRHFEAGIDFAQLLVEEPFVFVDAALAGQARDVDDALLQRQIAAPRVGQSSLDHFSLGVDLDQLLQVFALAGLQHILVGGTQSRQPLESQNGGNGHEAISPAGQLSDVVVKVPVLVHEVEFDLVANQVGPLRAIHFQRRHVRQAALGRLQRNVSCVSHRTSHTPSSARISSPVSAHSSSSASPTSIPASLSR